MSVSKAPQIGLVFVLVVACAADQIDRLPSGPPPLATNVGLTRNGVWESLPDATVGLIAAETASGVCSPSVRIHLLSQADDFVASIDLDRYINGALVLSPNPPFTNRAPTITVFDSGSNTSFSGGPASFAVDAKDVHTLTLESPNECIGRWREVEPVDCVAVTPVVLEFTGVIDETLWCSGGVPGAELDSTGMPYCVPQATTGNCP